MIKSIDISKCFDNTPKGETVGITLSEGKGGYGLSLIWFVDALPISCQTLTDCTMEVNND